MASRFLFLAVLWLPLCLRAQHVHNAPAANPAAEAAASPASTFLMEQSSGTSSNPSSSPMHMLMVRARGWGLMAHGQGHIGLIQQSGPRGGDKAFSSNWFMGMAERRVGRGSLMIRSMLSLEPATVTRRRYPLLFQTGETAFGRAIADGQHPHDFVMELAVQYAVPLGERTMFNLYVAPVGDPALGPVAFPHRVSASELPQATLGHHLQDSTHIANEVITAGIQHRFLRLEASGFHGAEPNEARWNIDHGGLDSWAARLTLMPAANVVAQVSVGRLHRPEALESTDIVRSTASIAYNRPMEGGHWATSFIWGRNHKTAGNINLNSCGLESLLRFREKNYLTGRFELVDKDELLGHDGPEGAFRIAAYTLGYTRDVKPVPGLDTGLGFNFSLYGTPRALDRFYGSKPAGFMVYLRFRIRG